MLNPAAKLVRDLAKAERSLVRDGFGKGLVRAGELDERVVALTADLAESARTHFFAERFPNRFFQVGVAEQNLVTVASGLAAMGKIPFASSYAAFSPGRNWEQIRTTIAYNNVPVKLASSHAGLSVGPDGATHQMCEDLALMRALPNVDVLAPCDEKEAFKATLALAQTPKPGYIRFTRDKSPAITTEQTPFAIGKAVVFRNGADACIVACGPLVYEALVAAEALAKNGLDVRVLNSPSIKPLDEKTILAAAKETGALVTAEEHEIAGGLGGAVCELLAEKLPTPVQRIGVRDVFGESGTAGELFKKYGLDATAIAAAVKRAVSRKRA